METQPQSSEQLQQASKHHIVIVDGGRDITWPYKVATFRWEKKYGLTPHSTELGWSKDNLHLEPKLQKLRDTVNELAKGGNKVSLIGVSASAAPVLLTLLDHPDLVEKVVIVAGRIKSGSVLPAVNEATELLQQRLEALTEVDRQALLSKVLTLSSTYDKFIPLESSMLDGARNEIMRTPIHPFAIASAFIDPVTTSRDNTSIVHYLTQEIK